MTDEANAGAAGLIPEKLDPVRCAEKRLEYSGTVKRQFLTRLADMTESLEGDAEVSISFGKDPSGVFIMKGRASVPVSLVCERCGEPFSYSLQADFAYACSARQLKELGAEDIYDAVELDEFGDLSLYGIIEDELILALPMVPKHDISECSVKDDIQVFGEVKEDAPSEGNPFAGLGKLFK